MGHPSTVARHAFARIGALVLLATAPLGHHPPEPVISELESRRVRPDDLATRDLPRLELPACSEFWLRAIGQPNGALERSVCRVQLARHEPTGDTATAPRRQRFLFSGMSSAG